MCNLGSDRAWWPALLARCSNSQHIARNNYLRSPGPATDLVWAFALGPASAFRLDLLMELELELEWSGPATDLVWDFALGPASAFRLDLLTGLW